MTVAEPRERELPASDEGALVAAALAGDGSAFATLYERHEGRAFNLAYRITGSRDDAADAVQEAFVGMLRRLPEMGDRELAFGSYILTATRNACYDLLAARRRAEPSDSISEAATPVGGGAGGLGLDPGDPEEDPSRRQLLESQRTEIRAANERLPERQREALALRELEGLSYDEIAEVMGMNRNSVAQLISRARLNLRTELRGEALGSIAPASPQCERALPLIAKRDDGELGDGEDAAWLDSHLAGCGGCRARREAMEEAGVSYRAWAPIAAAPWLMRETMARAAEQLGVDWSEVIAERTAAREAAARPRRAWAPAAAIAGLVVVAVLAGARALDDPGPPPEAGPAVPAAAQPAASADAEPRPKQARRGRRAAAPGDAPEAAPTAAPAAAPTAAGEPEPPQSAPDASPTRSAPNARPPARRAPVASPERRPGPGTTQPAPETTPPAQPAEEPEREPDPGPGSRPPTGPGNITSPSPPGSGPVP